MRPCVRVYKSKLSQNTPHTLEVTITLPRVSPRYKLLCYYLEEVEGSLVVASCWRTYKVLTRVSMLCWDLVTMETVKIQCAGFEVLGKDGGSHRLVKDVPRGVVDLVFTVLRRVWVDSFPFFDVHSVADAHGSAALPRQRGRERGSRGAGEAWETRDEHRSGIRTDCRFDVETWETIIEGHALKQSKHVMTNCLLKAP